MPGLWKSKEPEDQHDATERCEDEEVEVEETGHEQDERDMKQQPDHEELQLPVLEVRVLRGGGPDSHSGNLQTSLH